MAPFLAAQDSLMAYAVLQDRAYVPLKWHRYLCERLEAAVARGHGRIMVFAPPQHGKSRMVSTEFPSWVMGKHPDWPIISASYGTDLADRNGQSVRDRISSSVHAAVFPKSRLLPGSTAKTDFQTTNGGQYLGTTVRGGGTGFPSKVFVIDDPFKNREDADSKRVRESVKDWYRSVVYTRLAEHSILVLMHTRWHADDLAGWLMDEHRDEGWEIIELPALAREDDPLGREVDEPLAPERFSHEALQKKRRVLGSREWSALYQQRPVPGEGGFFQYGDLKKYNRQIMQPKTITAMARALIVDPAATKGKRSDYTAMLVVGLHTDDNYYVLDGIRERLSQSERWKALLGLVRKYKPRAVLYKIRRFESDEEYIAEKQEAEQFRFDVTYINEVGPKETRIESLLALFEAHRIYIPHEWHVKPQNADARSYNLTEALTDEHTDFPAAAHDDLYDALSEIKNPAFPSSLLLDEEAEEASALAPRVQRSKFAAISF